MLVRIKKEIIAFGVPGIEPAKRTAPKLAPQELKRWLDEGRPVTLLDTRNDYEVKAGTFKNAVTLGIDHFRNFPAAVQQLPAELKQQPIVMFCTGGIRCEKAGPYMEREGFEQVFQLDGGILKYFEECGGDALRGRVFRLRPARRRRRQSGGNREHAMLQLPGRPLARRSGGRPLRRRRVLPAIVI